MAAFLTDLMAISIVLLLRIMRRRLHMFQSISRRI